MLNKNRGVAILGLAITVGALLLALTVTGVFAGEVSNGTYKLTHPDTYESCTPSDNIKVSGVPDGWTVDFTFRHDDGSGMSNIGTLEVVSDGTDVIVPFPYDGRTGRFQVIAAIKPPGEQAVASLKGEWTVTCEEDKPTPTSTPEKPDGEGCTPGFWRQEHHYDSWVGYSPGDSFDAVFGVTSSFGGTLGEAVQLGGGGEYALARHAVAALLNATSDVNYAFTEAEVIAAVQAAYSSGDFEGAKDQFEEANEAFCPLD